MAGINKENVVMSKKRKIIIAQDPAAAQCTSILRRSKNASQSHEPNTVYEEFCDEGKTCLGAEG